MGKDKCKVDDKETDDEKMVWTVFEKWPQLFDERQCNLISSCRQYVADGAPGLPGHQLMIIVAKLAVLLDEVVGSYPPDESKE